MPSLNAGALGVALSTLRSNPLRTLLSTLGIVMGMASLVAVLSIGDGLERFARDQVSRTTDVQTIVVQPTEVDVVDGVAVPRTDYARFDLADRNALQDRLGARAGVGIATTGGSRLVAGDSARGVIVAAVTPEMFEQTMDSLAAGAAFSADAVRDSSRVAMISWTLASALDSSTPADVVGRKLQLEEATFEVVGVERAQEGPAARSLRAVVPFTTQEVALARASSARAAQMVVRVRAVEDLDAVRAEVESWLAERGGVAEVRTYSAARIEQVQQGILIFKLAMGTFAGISLLVGGIGIMNVLLASVTERTREIGIRKATGASHRDLLAQFLTESVAISAVGSVLGAALGIGGAYAATAIMRAKAGAFIYAGLSLSTLLVAAAISVATGLLFGAYPALRAARLSPIEAIRHE
ncbi:MAG TPA: ABC transporter permease [Gemmatimonadales bacterium]|nr:ABC transporter permease [Gemmatimonadales bacterium]